MATWSQSAEGPTRAEPAWTPALTLPGMSTVWWRFGT
jgi:hypothetical protein